MMTVSYFLLFGLFFSTCSSSFSIDQFSSRPGDASVESAYANSAAIHAALKAANNSISDRVVVIPEGTYYVNSMSISNVFNITLDIRGTVYALDNLTAWPMTEDHSKYLDVFSFSQSHDLTITGYGIVDGQGYRWWEAAIFQSQKVNDQIGERPYLLVMQECYNILIEGVDWKNSPMYHLYLHDVTDVEIRGFSIVVDTKSQKALLSGHGLLSDLGIPLFPLNTDGIDPAGRNILIHDVHIENYDDAIAVKPLTGSGLLAQCSENILIKDCTVIHSVGMTIGSVPPNDHFNCVNNVTFRNISFESPFKAIYVKTNPGTHGYGSISNIVYQDITINKPIWWAIYIGPQQQKQPNGQGPGCMFYPLGKCATQPRVPMKNIMLQNIHISNGLLGPGIIRCNETAPCTGFVFDNVRTSGFMSSLDYICDYVSGTASSSHPTPRCLQDKRRIL